MNVTELRNKVVSIMSGWIPNGHADILDIYNSYKPLPRNYKVKMSDAWCAATVSAAWIKAGVASICPIECSCSKIIEKAKKLKIWVEDDKYVPKPGDALIYDWGDGSNYASTDNQGNPDHIGIVKKVSDGKIVVIEGNLKGSDGVRKVGTRTINVNGRYIRGFVTPNYAKLADPDKTVHELALEVLAGKWGNGAVRKSRLTAAGYDYDKVQAEVNRISSSPTGKPLDEIAREVIAGKWGNGAVRKNRLKAAGYDPVVIQAIVNKMLNK